MVGPSTRRPPAGGPHRSVAGPPRSTWNPRRSSGPHQADHDPWSDCAAAEAGQPAQNPHGPHTTARAFDRRRHPTAASRARPAPRGTRGGVPALIRPTAIPTPVAYRQKAAGSQPLTQRPPTTGGSDRRRRPIWGVAVPRCSTWNHGRRSGPIRPTTIPMSSCAAAEGGRPDPGQGLRRGGGTRRGAAVVERTLPWNPSQRRVADLWSDQDSHVEHSTPRSPAQARRRIGRSGRAPAAIELRSGSSPRQWRPRTRRSHVRPASSSSPGAPSGREPGPAIGGLCVPPRGGHTRERWVFHVEHQARDVGEIRPVLGPGLTPSVHWHTTDIAPWGISALVRRSSRETSWRCSSPDSALDHVSVLAGRPPGRRTHDRNAPPRRRRVTGREVALVVRRAFVGRQRWRGGHGYSRAVRIARGRGFGARSDLRASHTPPCGRRRGDRLESFGRRCECGHRADAAAALAPCSPAPIRRAVDRVRSEDERPSRASPLDSRRTASDPSSEDGAPLQRQGRRARRQASESAMTRLLLQHPRRAATTVETGSLPWFAWPGRGTDLVIPTTVRSRTGPHLQTPCNVCATGRHRPRPGEPARPGDVPRGTGDGRAEAASRLHESGCTNQPRRLRRYGLLHRGQRASALLVVLHVEHPRRC